MIFDSMAAIRSFENPISMRRSPAASGSRPLRITKSSMNHLSLRDPLSQASDGVVAAHLSVVTFATKSAPRNTPLPRTHQGSSCGRVADRGARSAAACDAGDRRLTLQNAPEVPILPCFGHLTKLSDMPYIV